MNPPAPDRHHSRAPRTTRSKRNGLQGTEIGSQNKRTHASRIAGGRVAEGGRDR